jgi:hypothetical protein
MSPLSSGTSPAIAPSSVDLPQPLGPTTAIRSPGAMLASACSSRGVPPRDSVIRRSRIIARDASAPGEREPR